MKSDSNPQSPDYGRRLFPTLIDERASSEPTKPFAAIPKSSDLRDGFVDISYHQLATAINRCSWWLQDKLGKSQNFETVGYLGILDMRYTILMFACIKVGYKAFFTSPRNSLQAHLSLLERTECNIFLLSDVAPSIVEEIVEMRQMNTISFPGLDYFLHSHAIVDHYPYLKTFDEARLEPLVVLHTSGSTGVPKPVIMVHGTLSCIDAYRLIPSLGGREVAGPSWEGTRLFLAFPLFHAASMCYLLGLGIYCGVICVLPPSGVPLNASIADQIHTTGNVQGSALPPSLLVDLVKESSFQKNLWPLQYVIYAGGPLPKETGEEICSKTKLITLTGSTEVGLPAIEIVDRDDWDYLSYSHFMGYEYRPIELDGMYEQFIVRQNSLDLFQSVFSTFPNLNEYSMKDLYERHPTKPGLVRLRGRTDDVITFSTAEKLNPTTMENTINSHPGVLSALVAGHGKLQPCLLIESRDAPASEDAKERMIEDIWPTVQRANQDCPAHGRIMKDFITFANPENPFLRSGKGTVQRMMTLDLYKSQIDMLYEPGNTSARHLAGPHVTVQGSLPESLFQISKSTWLKELTYTSNLFEAGLDSVQVVALVKNINSYLRDCQPDMQHVSPATIYAHPSVAALEETLTSPTTTQLPDSTRKSAAQRMQRLFDKYFVNLHVAEIATSSSRNQEFVVLLTGSTGSLGTHLLDRLSVSASVGTVYCLNRGRNAEERQTKSHQGKGLPTRFKNVNFLRCDFSRPLLGLDEVSYTNLLTNVTHIIHNAWDVNFNRSVDSFEATHIHGTRRLLDFAAASHRGARMQFISTTATVMGPEAPLVGKVQEKVYERKWGMALEMGYAQSKLVAENLVAAISQASRFDALICRVGQITGAISGFGPWARNEWVSSLVASSVSLGKIPGALGPNELVDWLPVTTVAMSLLELLFATEDSACGPRTMVYHIVNPFKTSWSDLLPSFTKYCTSDLEVVAFATWLEALQRSSPGSRDTPAARLMGFFEKLQSLGDDQVAVLDTTEALKLSRMLAAPGPVNEAWVKHWMEQWGFYAGVRGDE